MTTFCIHANDTSHALVRQLLGKEPIGLEKTYNCAYIQVFMDSGLYYPQQRITNPIMYPNQLEQLILLPTSEARVVLLREFMREYAKGVGHGEL